jgi:putative IMPACT (imprinted ancient) family translation regulator
VVTRYFGGVKLGSGGLVRAYQGTLRLGLNNLPRRLFRVLARLEVTVAYSRIDRLRRLLPEFAATVEIERFGASASFSLRLPETRVEDFSLALAAATEGEAVIEREPAM